MSGMVEFNDYIRREFNCNSLNEYVYYVLNSLNDGINSLSEVIIYIVNNYDNSVYEAFLDSYESVLSGDRCCNNVFFEYSSMLESLGDDAKFVKVRKQFIRCKLLINYFPGNNLCFT